VYFICFVFANTVIVGKRGRAIPLQAWTGL